MEDFHVFKISYGNTVRRITLKLVYTAFNLSPNGQMFRELKAAIRRDFKIPQSSELVLAYTDEEHDKVTMVNDDDIRDACLHQKLNPVRVSVVAPGPDPSAPDDSLPAGDLSSEDITPPWAAEIISKLDQLLLAVNKERVSPSTEPTIIDPPMTARHILEEADDFLRVIPEEHVDDPDSEFRRRAMILRQRVMTDETTGDIRREAWS